MLECNVTLGYEHQLHEPLNPEHVMQVRSVRGVRGVRGVSPSPRSAARWWARLTQTPHLLINSWLPCKEPGRFISVATHPDPKCRIRYWTVRAAEDSGVGESFQEDSQTAALSNQIRSFCLYRIISVIPRLVSRQRFGSIKTSSALVFLFFFNLEKIKPSA